MTPFELIVVVLLLFLGIFFYISLSPLIHWLKSNQTQMQGLQSTMTNSMQQSDKNITDTLQQSYKSLNERLEAAARVMGELKTETGKFSEIGRSVQSLQDFLNSPKLRGNIGEQVLSDLMSQVLPADSYETQYHFKSGDIVDAVIKTQAGIIPIDSKFPMENYAKLSKAKSKLEETEYNKLFVADVKKHIKAISQKYIKTSEKTVDFALMYIPAESIYYEITANQAELTQAAQTARVLLVSPATFYAFLRTILVSFEGIRIADEARNILRNIREVQQESQKFAGKLETLTRHVTNSYNSMSAVNSDFAKLHTTIVNTNQLYPEKVTELLPDES